MLKLIYNKNKIISLILGTCIILCMLFSMLFIVKHSNHHCNDIDNCAICIQICNCIEKIRDVSIVILSASSALYVLYTFIKLAKAKYDFIINTTLVTLKVKFTN